MTAWLYAVLLGLLAADRADKRRRELARLEVERQRLARMFNAPSARR